MNKFKIFVSLPMAGRSDEEIISEQNRIINKLNIDNCELIQTCIKEDYDSPLWYLGRSIQLMADADLVVFSEDWHKARGCHIEHMVVVKYGLPYADLSNDFSDDLYFTTNGKLKPSIRRYSKNSN